MKNLNISEQKLRDIYLKNLSLGKIQGPPTGKLSQDKPWLVHFSDEQILTDMPEMIIYDFMVSNNQGKEAESSIAYSYFGNNVTYKKFIKQIQNCANGLLKKGVKPNDIITVISPNYPQAVITFFAANMIGAITEWIHPLSAENEIKKYLQQSKSKFLITADIAYEKVSHIINETNVKHTIVASASEYMPLPLKTIYHMTKQYTKLPKDSKFITWNKFMSDNRLKKNKTIKQHPYKKDQVAVLLRTGGTSGTPKAVRLTNDNFTSMVEQFKQSAAKFSRGEKMLTIMPVFHGFGLCSSVLLPLSVGVSIVLIPKLNKDKIYHYFKKYKPNHIIGVPTLLKGILADKKLNKMDLSYLKNVVSGGAIASNDLENEFNSFLKNHGATIKLSKGYGLSEVVAGATFACNGYNNNGSIGIPMVATNMKIVDPKTDIEMSQAEIGEICISGPTVMQGYYNNEEATNKALKDGWLHTGDLGYYEDGNFYFKQRNDNMIISSGVNVYPNDIEQVINSYYKVDDCRAIGIPDPYKQSIVKVFIKLKDGYDFDNQTKQDIQNLCQKNLNKYSMPKVIECVDTLPQTLLGKNSYRGLQTSEKTKQMIKK